MYALIVCCTSLQLKMVLSIVQNLILAIFVVYREWVNLVIVSAWHFVFINIPSYCANSDKLFLFLLRNVLTYLCLCVFVCVCGSVSVCLSILVFFCLIV
jgi:hypothetical protein